LIENVFTLTPVLTLTSVLLHLIENTFDQKRIYANPSSYPNSNSNLNPNPNPNSHLNPNPKAQ